MTAMLSFYDTALISAVVVVLFVLYRKMPRNGNLRFKLGYYLYTRTKIGYYYYHRQLTKAAQRFGKNGHSVVEATTTNGLTIVPIAMSMDNYSYLIMDEEENVSVLVDPADPESVQTVLDARKASPAAILSTHKHWDHSAGNRKLKKRFPSVVIYGGKGEDIPAVTNPVSDGDRLEFGRLKFTVYETPGHTIGHVVYLLDGERFGAPGSLFSGDHLFIGGIGKIFEGTAQMMLRSLDRLSNLPDDVLLWPGHEYSLANLQFDAELEPDNQAVREKLQHFSELRMTRLSTCPSTLGTEKQYNPFLRTGDVNLQRVLGLQDSGVTGDALRVEVLLQCRTRKDRYHS